MKRLHWSRYITVLGDKSRNLVTIKFGKAKFAVNPDDLISAVRTARKKAANKSSEKNNGKKST